jgi:hypothetical protein
MGFVMQKNRLLLAAASFVAPVVAFAQSSTPPTTAVGLAQAVDLSDAKGAGLVVAGLMITAGVVLWGARLVMSKFRPKV